MVLYILIIRYLDRTQYCKMKCRKHFQNVVFNFGFPLLNIQHFSLNSFAGKLLFSLQIWSSCICWIRSWKWLTRGNTLAEGWVWDYNCSLISLLQKASKGRMYEEQEMHTKLVGKSQGKKSPRRQGCRLENDIKINHR